MKDKYNHKLHPNQIEVLINISGKHIFSKSYKTKQKTGTRSTEFSSCSHLKYIKSKQMDQYKWLTYIWKI